MSKKIKGIMFDMGGTLIEDHNLSLDGGFECVYDHIIDKKITKEEFISFCDRLSDETLRKRGNFEIKFTDYVKFVLDFFDLELDKKVEDMEEEFSKGFSKDGPMDYVYEFLDKCKNEGLKLIVLSNTFLSQKEITRRLSEFELDKYFDTIIASSDSFVRKPSSLFFEYGLRKMGLSKDEVIYVGNSYYFDCKGANEVGLDVIYLNKYHYKEYGFEGFKVKVKEIQSYKEIMDGEICQIF